MKVFVERRRKTLHSLIDKKVLKTWGSDVGKHHTCIQQMRHVKHVTEL